MQSACNYIDVSCVRHLESHLKVFNKAADVLYFKVREYYYLQIEEKVQLWV